MRARAYAFDDLLPEIAAFLKMHGVHLPRFLHEHIRKIAAEARLEMADASGIRIFPGSRDSSHCFERLYYFIFSCNRAIDAGSRSAGK